VVPGHLEDIVKDIKSNMKEGDKEEEVDITKIPPKVLKDILDGSSKRKAEVNCRKHQQPTAHDILRTVRSRTNVQCGEHLEADFGFLLATTGGAHQKKLALHEKVKSTLPETLIAYMAAYCSNHQKQPRTQ
jgi:hypothetical protein